MPAVTVTHVSVFPTRVGVDLDQVIIVDFSHSFPHTRGGGPVAASGVFETATVFPTRVGVDRPRAEHGGAMRKVFPTRVGVDRTMKLRHFLLRRFPHTRGGGPRTYIIYVSGTQFSPHAWGWTARVVGPAGTRGVFPTRVGVDRVKKQ